MYLGWKDSSALSKDSGSIPNTHMTAHNGLTLGPRDPMPSMPSSDLQGHQACECAQTCLRINTYTHKNYLKILKIKAHV